MESKKTGHIPFITFESILNANSAIKNHALKTDVVSSPELNKMLGHEIYFKLENLQKTGSFKFRGALYTVLKLKNNPPKHIVTYGTGNHAVALAWAASEFLGIKVKAYLPTFTSEIKKNLIKKYGAEIIFTDTRLEAEAGAKNEAKKDGTILLAPSDNDDIIAGAGTVALEALEQLDHNKIDAIFFPIGGCSLASGTVVAARTLSPETQIYGAEPKNANDASMSYKANKICQLSTSPETIADGAKTMRISERVFPYLKKLDGVYEITEMEIEYWTAWYNYLIKYKCEPTSALALAGAFRWLKKQEQKQKILVIITGSHMNEAVDKEISSKNYLDITPNNFDY